MKPIYSFIIITLLLCSSCTVVHRPPYEERRPPPEPPRTEQRYSYVCHKGKTLYLHESRVRAHLRHGDYRGKCRRQDPPRRSQPPRYEPPRRDPPRHEPPPWRQPPRAEPRDPPRHEPPRRDPPRAEPPRRPPREERVTVCHKGKTLEIAASALRAHLRHGDTRGPCPRPPSRRPGPPRDSVPPQEQPVQRICHRGRTLEVPASAVEGYLRRGAQHGACRTQGPNTDPNAPRRDQQPSRYREKKYEICHNGQTLNLPLSEALKHLKHGDSSGPCR